MSALALRRGSVVKDVAGLAMYFVIVVVALCCCAAAATGVVLLLLKMPYWLSSWGAWAMPAVFVAYLPCTLVGAGLLYFAGCLLEEALVTLGQLMRRLWPW